MPTIEGRPVIMTVSGQYVDLFDPDPSTFRLDDIAWALSMTARFGGHCPVFYSVAEHCVRVSAILPPELQLTGLLHDAAEAYLGDVVKPLKQALTEYHPIEENMERALMQWFGGIFPMPPEIKEADLRLLATERRDIMRAKAKDWEHPGGLELPIKILPWHQDYACRMYLESFAILSGEEQT